MIPVYKAEAFLADAVSSALQCAEVKEVILVDDGSKGDSLAECHRLAGEDPRIILLRHPNGVNKGASASRNLGVAHATRPYIAFLDADDRYLPNRFDAEHRIFAEVPDAEGVYGALGAHFHSATSRQRFEAHHEGATLTTVAERVAPEELLRSLVTRKDFGHFSLNTLTVKRAVLDRIDALFAEDLRLHQDTEFIYRLAHQARLYPGSIEAPVALRGVHDGNRSTANRDPAGTSMILYDRLCRWADHAGVPEEVKGMLRARSLQARFKKADGIGERWHIGRELWRLRAFLSPYEKKHIFTRMVVGPYIYRALHGMFGKGPSSYPDRIGRGR